MGTEAKKSQQQKFNYLHLAYCHLNIAQHNMLVILYPECGGIIFQAQFKVIRQTELQSSEILKQKKQVLPAERD